MVEIAVGVLPDENGNIPDIGKPVGLRITSKDGSAVGKIISKIRKQKIFVSSNSWERLSACDFNVLFPSW